MAIETEKYRRNPIFVDAVEVTPENFAEVAAWCGGEFANKNGMPIERNGDGVIVRPDEMYIRIEVLSPKNVRQTQAMVGDFILYTERGYKVYTPGAFHATWTKVV